MQWFAVSNLLRLTPLHLLAVYSSHPDYPGVAVTIPENAFAPKSPFTLELKVGVTEKVQFLLYKDSIEMHANKISPKAF